MAASSRWRCCALALLLLACLRMRAQDPYSEEAQPTPERIATLLKSGDPRDRAWGAFHAVRTKDASFLPELTGLAERWEAAPRPTPEHPTPQFDDLRRDERYAMAAVLDGVILFKGKLSPRVLLPLIEDFPAQGSVLLARLSRSEMQPVAWALFSDPHPVNSAETRIGASMLALNPPPAFTAKLLHDLRVTMTVFVFDGDGKAALGNRENDLYGQVSLNPKPGWPDIAQYMLEEGDGDDDREARMPIAGGLRPIFAVRSRSLFVGVPHGMRCLSNPVRVELIVQILRVRDGVLGISAHVDTNISTTTTADYEKALTEAVKAQLDAFQSVERRLTARGYVSLDEMSSGASEPELILSLGDLRADKSFDLPKIVFNRGRVSWGGK